MLNSDMLQQAQIASTPTKFLLLLTPVIVHICKRLAQADRDTKDFHMARKISHADQLQDMWHKVYSLHTSSLAPNHDLELLPSNFLTPMSWQNLMTSSNTKV